METSRRLGSEKSKRREAILKAAARVLEEQGAAGLTSAQVGQAAGLNPQLIYYYFRTMDDLIVALVRTVGREGVKNIARAITSDDPIGALWELNNESRWAVVSMEILALATHRDVVRAELNQYVEQMRSLQTEAVSQYFLRKGIKSDIPPIAVTLMMAGIAGQLTREKEFNMTYGHAETLSVIRRLIDAVSGEKGGVFGGRASRKGRTRVKKEVKRRQGK